VANCSPQTKVGAQLDLLYSRVVDIKQQIHLIYLTELVMVKLVFIARLRNFHNQDKIRMIAWKSVNLQ